MYTEKFYVIGSHVKAVTMEEFHNKNFSLKDALANVVIDLGYQTLKPGCLNFSMDLFSVA